MINFDDKRSFNCVVPFGDGFGGGDLVLRQMKMRIELEVGDRFFLLWELGRKSAKATGGRRNE